MITKRLFDETSSKKQVNEYRLENKRGNYCLILDYGCRVRALVIDGVDVCLGFDTMESYEADDSHVGSVVGRVANRISKASFSLNGVTYNLAKNAGNNHIHGGIVPFDSKVWDSEIIEDSLLLKLVSPDMEEGYPGNLTVTVKYTFTDDDELKIEYSAVSDKDTVLNLTSHMYFNLNGEGSGSVLGHMLTVNSESITENDYDNIPTGVIIDVNGTPFDFTKLHSLGENIDSDDAQIHTGNGYDHNYALNNSGKLTKVAVLTGEKTGITMSVFTDRPGLQLYTSNWHNNPNGKNSHHYKERESVCLETQEYPDAINHDNFPSPVLKAGERFYSVTCYRFDKG